MPLGIAAPIGRDVEQTPCLPIRPTSCPSNNGGKDAIHLRAGNLTHISKQALGFGKLDEAQARTKNPPTYAPLLYLLPFRVMDVYGCRPGCRPEARKIQASQSTLARARVAETWGS